MPKSGGIALGMIQGPRPFCGIRNYEGARAQERGHRVGHDSEPTLFLMVKPVNMNFWNTEIF